MVAKSEQASLWTLYLTAYRLYQREVIEQKKLYKRFKDDFINGNTYPKRCDVDGLNEYMGEPVEDTYGFIPGICFSTNSM